MFIDILINSFTYWTDVRICKYRPFVHFRIDYKIMRFYGRTNDSLHMPKFHQNNIFPSIICEKKNNVEATCDFSSCSPIILWFFKRFNYLQITRKLCKKYLSLTLLFYGSSTIMPAIREIFPIETYNFRIESEMYKYQMLSMLTM